MHNKWQSLPLFLLTGANGQLGAELGRSLSTIGQVVRCTRKDMDLSQPDEIRRVVRAYRPDVILNAAAYTDVDGAEADATLAMAVNGIAPGVLAAEAHALGSLLVHYSTDYVFDGEQEAPYVETDATHPLSVYGKTKLAGEHAVLNGHAQVLVFRTAWLAGLHGRNFARTILDLARVRDDFPVVSDQIGTPTTTTLVAEVTTLIVARYLQAKHSGVPMGVYHLTAAGQVSRHGYAVEVLRYAQALGMRLKTAPEDVREVLTAELQGGAGTNRPVARRPRNSMLDICKVQDTFGIQMPDWRQGIHALIDQWAISQTEVATWH